MTALNPGFTFNRTQSRYTTFCNNNVGNEIVNRVLTLDSYNALTLPPLPDRVACRRRTARPDAGTPLYRILLRKNTFTLQALPAKVSPRARRIYRFTSPLRECSPFIFTSVAVDLVPRFILQFVMRLLCVIYELFYCIGACLRFV